MPNFYQPLRNRPIAKFFYKGASHTHPVRRTVVITDSRPRYFRGYEIREGAEERTLTTSCPVKTYRRNRIAKIGDIDARRVLRREAGHHDMEKSTLVRMNWSDLLRTGV